jgi:hypothetical protein
MHDERKFVMINKNISLIIIIMWLNVATKPKVELNIVVSTN